MLTRTDSHNKEFDLLPGKMWLKVFSFLTSPSIGALKNSTIPFYLLISTTPNFEINAVLAHVSSYFDKLEKIFADDSLSDTGKLNQSHPLYQALHHFLAEFRKSTLYSRLHAKKNKSTVECLLWALTTDNIHELDIEAVDKAYNDGLKLVLPFQLNRKILISVRVTTWAAILNIYDSRRAERIEYFIAEMTCIKERVVCTFPPYINFAKADLREINLTYLDFTGANLSRAILSDTMLSHTNFSNAVLVNANFRDSSGYNTIFYRSNLSHAKFINAILPAANMRYANGCGSTLISSIFDTSNFNQSAFNHARIQSTSIIASNINNAEFQYLRLLPNNHRDPIYYGALDLTHTTLHNTSLMGTSLNGITFHQCRTIDIEKAEDAFDSILKCLDPTQKSDIALRITQELIAYIKTKFYGDYERHIAIDREGALKLCDKAISHPLFLPTFCLSRHSIFTAERYHYSYASQQLLQVLRDELTGKEDKVLPESANKKNKCCLTM